MLVWRVAYPVAFLVAALATSLALAGRVDAAMQILVTVSPASVPMGQRAEILIRTFLPLGRPQLGLNVPEPRTPLPAPSGSRSVLYLFADDYLFRVEGRGPRGESVPIEVARDRQDASLYHGSVTLPSPGRWRTQVLNYVDSGSEAAAGSWADVDVVDATSRGSDGRSAGVWSDPWSAAAMAAVVATAIGFALGRRRDRRPGQAIGRLGS